MEETVENSDVVWVPGNAVQDGAFDTVEWSAHLVNDEGQPLSEEVAKATVATHRTGHTVATLRYRGGEGRPFTIYSLFESLGWELEP